MKILQLASTVALSALALGACGGSPSTEVRSASAVSTTTARNQGAPQCGRPVEHPEALPAEVPKVDEPQLVLGPDCTIGQVAGSDFFGDETGRQDFAPIHPRGGGDEVIGYWVVGIGWVTPEAAEASGFDAARVQEIAPSPYEPTQSDPGKGS